MKHKLPQFTICLSLLLAGVGSTAQVLSPNSVLTNGQSISSTNNKYKLVMQGDGNLVYYRNDGAVRFATYKYGNGNFAVMQGDGNFVHYTSSSKALWYSNTAGNSGARLVAQDDGNLVIYSAANKSLWNIGADINPSASPTKISEVVGRDLLIPGASWAGHVGLWSGSWVIEVMSDQPANAIRLSSIAGFKNAAMENNYTYWGVSSPDIPTFEVNGCFEGYCYLGNEYKPNGQREIVSLRLAIAKRAYQSFLIGADFTTTIFYVPTWAGDYYSPPTRGTYRCDTFILDSYKVVQSYSPADWESRLSRLGSAPFLPRTLFDRLKTL